MGDGKELGFTECYIHCAALSGHASAAMHAALLRAIKLQSSCAGFYVVCRHACAVKGAHTHVQCLAGWMPGIG